MVQKQRHAPEINGCRSHTMFGSRHWYNTITLDRLATGIAERRLYRYRWVHLQCQATNSHRLR